MLEHIIFDFDGVVADTYDMNLALCQEHDPIATVEDFLAHHDGNVHAEPRIRFKPERVHLFFESYQKQLTTGHLAKAIPTIQRLGEHYALHIISSTSERIIREVLDRAGILSLFKQVMGVETHKSKVEKFKMLIEGYCITPDNSIFVTDTLGDIKEAHLAGIRAVALTFGYHSRERLEGGNPFKIADSWNEIETIIDSL